MTNANNSNLSLFESLMNASVPTIAKTGRKHSFSVVNSRNNGKRITISKSVANHLALSDKVFAMPAECERKLVFSRTRLFPKSIELKLSGDGKKICYNAKFVELLTDMFGIDFKQHVSRTYVDVEFDIWNDEPVAIVNFPEQKQEEAVA